MIMRRRLVPNNRAELPLEALVGLQFANVRYPKQQENQSVVSWSSPGKGQQGESVTGGSYRQSVIRRQHNTRAN